MPDEKISQLDPVTDVLDADDYVLARAGASKRITGASLKADLGGSSASVPLGQAAGWTTDSTTYDNTLTGSGKFVTLVQSAADGAVFAIAIEGDAHPRWVMDASSGGGLYMGDGTSDPVSGANLFYSGGVVSLSGPSGVSLGGDTQVSGELDATTFGSSGKYLVSQAGPPTPDTTYLGAPLVLDTTGDLWAWNQTRYIAVSTGP